jgi:hypothetical protein
MRKVIPAVFVLAFLLLAFIPHRASAFESWWDMPRPEPETGLRYYTYVEELHQSAKSDNKASVGLGVYINKYHENDDPVAPFYGNDGVDCEIAVTSNSRKIINYGLLSDTYVWHNVINQLTLGDNTCASISIPGFKARFYGGAGSCEYESFIVSSNGVIFLNNSCTDPYYTKNIPDSAGPNCFIAPFWRDLKPNLDGTVTYGIVYHPPCASDSCLCISWNNVPDKNNNPQTFQVIIEPAPSWTPHGIESYYQSRIWFQYQTITLTDQTTIGIEAQRGDRGVSYNYLNLHNGDVLQFYQQSNYATLDSLEIEFSNGNDQYAWTDINSDIDHVRGENVQLQPNAGPDPTGRFVFALAGGIVTLVEAVYGGFVLGTIIWAVQTASDLAVFMKQAGVEINDHQPVSWIRAQCFERNYSLRPVDALFGCYVYWVFTDHNTEGHDLTITAKLGYSEYTYYGTLVGQRTLTTQVNLMVYIPSGCPFVCPWNGTDYVTDNNLLPRSVSHPGTDVDDYYKLEQPLVPQFQTNQFALYSLLIKELQTEHSYLDQVQLLAVDHASDVHIGVNTCGEIFTYKKGHPPTSCIDSSGNDVLNTINETDDQFFQGYAGDCLLANFENIDMTDGARLIMRADAPDGRKESIHIQVQHQNGDWEEVATVTPRFYWATEIVDLSEQMSQGSTELKIRLYFTADHEIDYIGLDATAQEEINVYEAHLISAVHSTEGRVTLKLLFNDEIYTELFPGEQIKLIFLLIKPQPAEARTFIFYTNGHYYTL